APRRGWFRRSRAASPCPEWRRAGVRCVTWRPQASFAFVVGVVVIGWSPDLADHLAAHALAACFAVGEDALGRRQDAHPEAAPHGWDRAGSDVDAQTRTAHPADAGDHRAACRVVAQPEPEGREPPLLDHGRLGEIALLDEHARDGLLVAGPRHV